MIFSLAIFKQSVRDKKLPIIRIDNVTKVKGESHDLFFVVFFSPSQMHHIFNIDSTERQFGRKIEHNSFLCLSENTFLVSAKYDLREPHPHIFHHILQALHEFF